MNNNIFKSIVIGFSVSVILFSCAPKKKVVATPTVQTPVIQAPKIEPEIGTLVPFTRDLFFKLKENGLDIKKLKFYVDNTIALNKIATTGNFEIDAYGNLVSKKGLAENVIKITPQVAGMVESIEADGLRLNFGRPNSTLKFFNNPQSPTSFSFNGDKFDKLNGTVEVPYNNSTYKASCDGCSNVTITKLMIKQVDIDAGINKSTIEPGAGSSNKVNLIGY